MMTAPEDYVGKIVKISGPFAAYHDEATGRDYFAVIVLDATACCSQGVEFVWNGEHSYPEDYPTDNQEITVIGKFDSYEENGTTYCQLVSAEMTVNE